MRRKGEVGKENRQRERERGIPNEERRETEGEEWLGERRWSEREREVCSEPHDGCVEGARVYTEGSAEGKQFTI